MEIIFNKLSKMPAECTEKLQIIHHFILFLRYHFHSLIHFCHFGMFCALASARCVTAPSSAHVCDPPCLSMRNNAPVEHCIAEAFILHRGIVRTMKASFNLRAHLKPEDTSTAR